MRVLAVALSVLLSINNAHGQRLTQEQKDCYKFIMQQVTPSELYAGPDGAVICESQEALRAYQILGNDLGAKQQYLNAVGSPCSKAKPDARFQVVQDQENHAVFWTAVRLREPSELKVFHSAAREWKAFPSTMTPADIQRKHDECVMSANSERGAK